MIKPTFRTFGTEYDDRSLLNRISSEQLDDVIKVRQAWSKGGRNVKKAHREVIRKLFDQGISQSILCHACRQESRNFQRMFERCGGPLKVRVSEGVIPDVAGQRRDLESCRDQLAREDDVLMPEGSHYASAASDSHERADMLDGADSGEGWEREDRQIDTRGAIER
jgi:hypothetical protein